ncbi:MAG: sulfite exporter TauE/SafE family protein, partial [Anaerolineales bacterium]|nr:sulfite exporter TauE/SafE family protein [Anaerolineales bacterium]
MNHILQSQQLLLGVSAALLPLGGLLYSFLNSWHCSIMCGPFAMVEEVRKFNLVLISRIVAYTSIGALMGALGQLLKDSLEVQLFGFVAFGLYA